MQLVLVGLAKIAILIGNEFWAFWREKKNISMAYKFM
jgi:hypothetical protein